MVARPRNKNTQNNELRQKSLIDFDQAAFRMKRKENIVENGRAGQLARVGGL